MGSREGAIVYLIHSLRPWRVSPRVRGAAGVIELPAGTLAACGVLFETRLRSDCVLCTAATRSGPATAVKPDRRCTT